MIYPSLYGLFVSAGIITAILVAERRAKRLIPKLNDIWKLVPLTVIFGLIGARLYHIIHYLHYYSANGVQVFFIWNGGLGIFGGLIGGFIGLYLSHLTLSADKKLSKISFLILLDVLAPAVPFSQAIGRLGNIANKEIIPYAYFEIAIDLLVVAFILLAERYKSGMLKRFFNFSGSLFFLYLLLYGFGRFFLEFIRTDNPWRLGFISVGQVFSLSMFLLSVSVIVYSKYKKSLL